MTLTDTRALAVSCNGDTHLITTAAGALVLNDHDRYLEGVATAFGDHPCVCQVVAGQLEASAAAHRVPTDLLLGVISDIATVEALDSTLSDVRAPLSRIMAMRGANVGWSWALIASGFESAARWSQSNPDAARAWSKRLIFDPVDAADWSALEMQAESWRTLNGPMSAADARLWIDAGFTGDQPTRSAERGYCSPGEAADARRQRLRTEATRQMLRRAVPLVAAWLIAMGAATVYSGGDLSTLLLVAPVACVALWVWIVPRRAALAAHPRLPRRYYDAIHPALA